MIIVFGSLNADFVFDCDKAPQEGETIRARAFRLEPGGKGANQAAAAARDGAKVAMIGAVGRDGVGDMLLKSLNDSGVDIGAVARVDAATGCAGIIIEDTGANRIVISGGANDEARAEQITDTLLRDASYLMLQMECPSGEVEAAIARAKAAGVRVVLNLAPALPLSEAALRACDILVVNETEAAVLAERLGCADDAKGLREALGIDVVRTLGADGLEAAIGVDIIRLPARPIKPVDTTAAGDCFVGVMVAALDAGNSMTSALQRATAAAALACSAKGCQASLPWKADTDGALDATS
jgi:ribokinase